MLDFQNLNDEIAKVKSTKADFQALYPTLGNATFAEYPSKIKEMSRVYTSLLIRTYEAQQDLWIGTTNLKSLHLVGFEILTNGAATIKIYDYKGGNLLLEQSWSSAVSSVLKWGVCKGYTINGSTVYQNDISSDLSDMVFVEFEGDFTKIHPKIFYGDTSGGGITKELSIVDNVLAYTIDTVLSKIPNSFFYERSNLNNDLNFAIPKYVTYIGNSSFAETSSTDSSKPTIIPSQIRTIDSHAFYSSAEAGTTHYYKFEIPSGVYVELFDAAANVDSPFHSKNAINAVIYTDNECIKNHDWSGANVTPTFYHLDGTPWE